jgi:hypothetical protein
LVHAVDRVQVDDRDIRSVGLGRRIYGREHMDEFIHFSGQSAQNTRQKARGATVHKAGSKIPT